MANSNVLFSRGSSSGFTSVIKDPNTLYFITDTHEIYLGNERYAIGGDINISVIGSGDIVSSVEWDSGSKSLRIILSEADDIASIMDAIRDAVQSCVKTVSSDRGSSILVDSSDPENIKLSLNIASGQHSGNVQLEECSDGLRANVEFPEDAIQGVASGDKVISLDDHELSSTLSISTEKIEGSTYVVLKGIGGQEISKFNASDFVKDGMLESVSLEHASDGSNHRILVFVFNTDSGKETIKIDVQEFINTYTAASGGGLKLVSDEFSIENEVSPSTNPINSDVAPGFGESAVLKAVKYDSHGLITGVGNFTFTIPNIPDRLIGDEDSTLIKCVGINNDGTLYGDSIDIATSINQVSTDSQIPTAKAVNDAVSDARTRWERI